MKPIPLTLRQNITLTFPPRLDFHCVICATSIPPDYVLRVLRPISSINSNERSLSLPRPLQPCARLMSTNSSYLPTEGPRTCNHTNPDSLATPLDNPEDAVRAEIAAGEESIRRFTALTEATPIPTL